MKNFTKTAIGTAKTVSKKTYIIGVIAILLPVIALGSSLTYDSKQAMINSSLEMQQQVHTAKEMLDVEITALEEEKAQIQAEIDKKKEAIKMHKATWHTMQGQIDALTVDFQTE